MGEKLPQATSTTGWRERSLSGLIRLVCMEYGEAVTDCEEEAMAQGSDQ
jgi:hypothetical protein